MWELYLCNLSIENENISFYICIFITWTNPSVILAIRDPTITANKGEKFMNVRMLSDRNSIIIRILVAVSHNCIRN